MSHLTGDHKQLVKESHAALVTSAVMHSGFVRIENSSDIVRWSTKHFNQYTTATLERIKNHNLKPKAASRLLSSLHFEEWDETNLNDYLVLHDLATSHFGRMDFSPHLRSAAYYPELVQLDSENEYPQKRAAQLRAIIRLAHELDGLAKLQWRTSLDGYSYVFIEDTDLLDMVFNPGPGWDLDDFMRAFDMRGIPKASTILKDIQILGS